MGRGVTDPGDGMEECPLCGDCVQSQGLDGHIRLAHAGERGVDRLLYWRQVRREARTATSAVAFLVGISEVDSDLNESTVDSCERVEEKADARIAEIVEQHASKVSP